MFAGLTAGAVAAIIAALVSLPLHSPVDSVFNSATVAVACLVLGVISGVLYRRLGERPLLINGMLGVLFVIVLVVAFVGNTLLDRFLSFVLPLAAIAFVVCAMLTPVLASYFNRPGIGWKSWAPASVAVIAALVVGFGLITQGDAESGELFLPPPPSGSRPTSASPTSASPMAVPTNTAVPSPMPATEAPAPTATAVAETPQPEGEAQAFVIGEGSEITFTVEEELGRSPIRFDAVISSTGLTGTANLDGQPSVVTLDLHSLESDQNFRDQYIRSRMFPDTTEAVVTVDEIPDLPQSFFEGEEATGQLDGSLQIGDRVTPLVFDVTARNDGNAVNILATTTFTWEQLGLSKPTARSVVYLADEVRVQVLLVARASQNR